MYTKRYSNEVNYDIAERFSAYAKEREVHPASLAIAWVMAHKGVTAPIIGARNLEQLEVALASLDLQMTQEWRNEISNLSVAPLLATDRAEEAL
ncbi:aldo/keto reductase [Halalkalibacter kiskunsagensis]|uniref:Aldo/keto reductase n=1 Tax=Halalkalibacter kiskunsagensis TaxID=1548599 RepID=A0ABV6KAS8_9BACI